jgi:hypothetical protein
LPDLDSETAPPIPAEEYPEGRSVAEAAYPRPAPPVTVRHPVPAGPESPEDFVQGEDPVPAGEGDAPDLRLEGIMWADAPENRFAVINGEIVRQGGMTQDIRVTRIAQDHVLVQSLDGTWKKRLSVR